MRHSGLPFLALLLTLAVPVAAQNASPAKSTADNLAADTTTAPPIAVPLLEIPSRAEASQARLEELRQILPGGRSITQIAATYAATQDTIQTLMRLEGRPGQEQPTKRSLTDMENEWGRRIAQMRTWQKKVSDRTNALTAMQVELGQREATWRLTMTEVKRGTAPPDVVELVEGVLRGTVALQDTVAVQMGEVIRLQSRLTRTVSTLQQVKEGVNAQLASLRRNLMHLDSRPLWRASSSADTPPSLSASVRAGAARTWQALGYFLDSYRLQLYLQLASTLGILLGIFWFRGHLEPHTTEQPAASARRILDHPTAGSILIIALATLFLYPRAPLVVYDLALLATVPAVLRLSPSFLPPNFIRPAAIGTLVFTVQRLGGLLLAGSVYQRPGILVLSVGGSVGLLWLLRKGGELESLGPDAYAVALRVSARLSAAALLVATCSNVIGNFSLATFLTTGTIASSYLLLVLLAAVRLADGVLIVLTRSEAAGVSRFVAQRKDALVRSGLRMVHLVAALAWLAITFFVFDLLSPTMDLARRLLAASFTIGALHLSLGAALLFITTVWVSVLVSRGLSSVLEVDILSRLDMPRGLPSVIGRLTRYTLIALGFIFALAAVGLELTQLTILGGALGIGIGFGLQNIVSNFVSGLILAFERPIREGDLIQLETLTGEVRRIGFRATIVRTFEGAEVIVPNASLISKDVVNWTLSDQQRRLTVQVGVAYGTDPGRVLALLRQVPEQYSSILKTPEPIALCTGFGDSALNFELRFWTLDADRVAIIRSDVSIAVNNALAAAGIEIPFPQRDLHLRTVDPTAADRLRRLGPADKEST